MTDTIPNALSNEAEAFGHRVRLNGGTAPRSLWILNSWLTRADDYRDDMDCPCYPELYETRELALQGFRDEMQCDIDEWDESERNEVDLDSIVERLNAEGIVGPEHSLDGGTTELTELPVWSGRRG